MSERDEGFLTRWSRRKRKAEPDVEPADVPGPEPAAEVIEGETERETLERLGLPDPDTLKAGDDFAAFMKAAVPEALKRRALRRLWTSNPVLANLDGLNDYDEDFTGGDLPKGALKTLYEVGRGFLAEDKIAEADAAATPSVETNHLAGAENGVREIDIPVEEATDSGLTPDGEEVSSDEEVSAPRRRRMSFRFPDQ